MQSARPRLDRDPIDLARANWRAAGWADAVDGMAVVTSVMRVHQILLAQVERSLKPFGLTFARYEVLMLLHFSSTGALPVGKIGERLQVHAASVTNAVDRLESDGLVRRMPNAHDRRSILAELTDQGRERALAASESVNSEVFTALPLDADTSVELYERLRSIRHAVGDFA